MLALAGTATPAAAQPGTVPPAPGTTALTYSLSATWQDVSYSGPAETGPDALAEISEPARLREALSPKVVAQWQAAADAGDVLSRPLGRELERAPEGHERAHAVPAP